MDMRIADRLRAALAAALLLILMTGCGSEPKASPDTQEACLQIGMLFDNFVMERWERDRDVFVSAARELGAEVNVQNANGSVEEQVKLMEYFIQKKVDAIVIVPIDSAPLLETVQKAQSANIKVIAYDRLIVGAHPDLYITFDNRKVGELMAQTLLSNTETTSDLLLICGPLTDHNVLEVEEGFLSEIQGKDVSVLDTYYTDGWKPENAGAYIREHRELVESVSGIMCGNDNLAGAVVDALAEQRLAGKVRVVGQDGDLAACQRIVEGTQSMTVYKPVDKLASRAAQETVRLIKGENLECEYFLTEDGDQIPYIRLAPVAVTLDNMQSVIIDSGFHLREDVYLNRPDLMKP